MPAYDAAVAALGTSDILVVGDSKMAALATRGHLVAQRSRYLCSYHPIKGARELATWVDSALAASDDWLRLEKVKPSTGEAELQAVVHAFEREQSWLEPSSQQAHNWNERVLLVQAMRYQAGLRRLREQALERLTGDLLKLAQGPSQGRKRYLEEASLAQRVAERIAEAKLEGVVQSELAPVQLRDGSSRWVVAAFWVDLTAWQAMVERLGWQVYVSNTSIEEYDDEALVACYHQQPVAERTFSRLKTRNLQLRPVFVRDETRIAGLVWLLCLAARILVLTEQRLRAALQEQGTALAGLNPASRSQATTTPTTERVIAVFRKRGRKPQEL